MKLEIVRETKIGEEPWYELHVDDRNVMGSYSLAKVENIFELYKNNPGNPLEETKVVLRSEEINVLLDK
jgi:hypothetical protein